MKNGKIIFTIVIIIGIFLICKKDTDKITLDEVRLKESKKESGMFAIMVQEEANTENYTLYDKEFWPTEGYIFNSTKSGCLDSDGKILEDVKLIYEEGKVKVETGNTSYCYIYFDKELLPADDYIKSKVSNEQLKSTGGMIRFQGTIADNYICFGTDTCSSQDDHMYRIIGIENDTGRLKIMKETGIEINGSKKIAWDSRYSQNIQWNESELKTNLNSSGFLDNSTYIPQDNNWKSIIDDTTEWKYGDIQDVNVAGTRLYLTEQSWKPSVIASIGLIYVSDYYLSYNDTINCSSNSSTCKTSWMHQSNNGDKSNDEWTMSRFGYYSFDQNNYVAWLVSSSGNALNNYILYAYVARPVFYLISDVKITGGDGKIGSPFTITP